MAKFRTLIVRDVRVRGRTCDRFPLVVNGEGGALLHVMRYLINCYGDGGAESAMLLYATHLRDFYEQLFVDQRCVTDVSLEYLNGYREILERRASKQYAAQILRTVLNHLLYLEQRGAICGVIGDSTQFKIRVTRTRAGGVSHKLFKMSASPKSNHCPSDRSIDALKSHGPTNERCRERFEIMVDWAHVNGLRAKEICGLRVDQLPDYESIQRALAEDRCLEVRLLVTKGGKARNIDVNPQLLARTRKFIDGDRASIMRKARARASTEEVTPVDSGYLFVSEITGAAITPKALSNAVRLAFLRAVKAGALTNGERVWLHGLRKRMVNRELQSRPNLEKYQRENEVRQKTGHSSIDSLARYVVTSK